MASPASRAAGRKEKETVISLIVVGLGPIGEKVVNEATEDPGFEVVQAIDPARAGEAVDRVPILGSVESRRVTGQEVAVLTTSSSLTTAGPDIEALLKEKLHVVSSCEELAFPWLQSQELAARIDHVAKQQGRSVLAAGVNPGFAMDVLPVMVGTICPAPQRVSVHRRVNVSRRRIRLQQKLGIGLTRDEWALKSGRGSSLGHAGLLESAYLCASGLGWQVEDQDFKRVPSYSKGRVQRVDEVVNLRCDDEMAVELRLTFATEGATRDEIEIGGAQAVKVTLDGVDGDVATVRRVLHGVKVVGHMVPGLRLSLEAPAWVEAGRTKNGE